MSFFQISATKRDVADPSDCRGDDRISFQVAISKLTTDGFPHSVVASRQNHRSATTPTQIKKSAVLTFH